MKRKRMIVLAVVVAASGLLLLNQTLAQPKAQPASAPAQEALVAVCDVTTILGKYRRMKDSDTEFKKRDEEIKAWNLKEIRALQTEQKKLNEIKEGTEDFRKQLKALREREIQVKARSAVERDALQLDSFLRMRAIYREVEKMIGLVARERNHQIVLHRGPGPMTAQSLKELLTLVQKPNIVYHADHADVTQIVLDRLNSTYQENRP